MDLRTDGLRLYNAMSESNLSQAGTGRKVFFGYVIVHGPAEKRPPIKGERAGRHTLKHGTIRPSRSRLFR